MSYWTPDHQQPPPPPPPQPPAYGGPGNRNSYYAPPPGTASGYPASPAVPSPSGYPAGGGNLNSYGAPPGTAPGTFGYQASPVVQQSPTVQSWGGQPPVSPGYSGYTVQQQQQQQGPGKPTQQSTPAPPSASFHTPQTYSPHGYNPHTYTPQTYNPQTYAPHSYNPQIYTPQSPQKPQTNIPQASQVPQTSTPHISQPYTPPVTHTQTPSVNPVYSGQTSQTWAPPITQSYISQPVPSPSNTQQSYVQHPYTTPAPQTYAAENPQTYPALAPQTSQPYSPQPTPTSAPLAYQTYSPQSSQTHPPPAPAQPPSQQPYSSQQYASPAPQIYTPQPSKAYSPQLPQTSTTPAPQIYSPAPQTYSSQIPQTHYPATTQSPTDHPYNSQQSTIPAPQTYTPQTPQSYSLPVAPSTTTPAPQTYSPQNSQIYPPPAPTQSPWQQNHDSQQYTTPAPQIQSPQNHQTYPAPVPQSYTPQTPQPYSPQPAQISANPTPQTFTPQTLQSYPAQPDPVQETRQPYVPQTYTPAPQPPQPPQQYQPHSTQSPVPQTQTSPAPPTSQTPQPYPAQLYTPQPYTPNSPPIYQRPFDGQQIPPPPPPPQGQEGQPTYHPVDTTLLEQEMNGISLNDKPLPGFPATRLPQTQVEEEEKKPEEGEKLDGKTNMDPGTSNPFLSMVQEQHPVATESNPFQVNDHGEANEDEGTAHSLLAMTKTQQPVATESNPPQVNEGLPMTTISNLKAQESAKLNKDEETSNPFLSMVQEQRPVALESNPLQVNEGLPMTTISILKAQESAKMNKDEETPNPFLSIMQEQQPVALESNPFKMNDGLPVTTVSALNAEAPAKMNKETSNPFLSMMQEQQPVALESNPFKTNDGLLVTTVSALNAETPAETNPFVFLLGSKTDASTQAALNSAITETNAFKLGLGVFSSSPGAPSTGPQLGLPSKTLAQHQVPISLQPPQQREKKRGSTCIKTPTAFSATWYTHPQAPGFYICSSCYEEHISGTTFKDFFDGAITTDGQHRWCKFNRPLYIELLKNAITTRSLDQFMKYIRERSQIPDCSGVNGAKGTAGVSWFVAKDHAIPNMVVCRACIQDYVLSRPALVANFIECPTKQDDDAVWSCDFAMPFIWKEYLERGNTGDWEGFCKEAKRRIALPACPGAGSVLASTGIWFTPSSGLDGLLICAECYSDYLHHSEDHANWCPLENPGDIADNQVVCGLGQINMDEALGVAQELDDMGIFWRAAVKMHGEPLCHADGVSNTKWFTLDSDPEDFAICARCYHGMVEPWGAAHRFMEKPGTDASTTRLCNFNRAAPRMMDYMLKAAEAFYTANPNVLTKYVEEWASIPPCPRDQDFKNRKWYGYYECTICPECYNAVARGTSLAASMPRRGEILSDSRLCELYSPRMRAIYDKACTTFSLTPLFDAVEERRKVYYQTVPLIRRIMKEAQLDPAKHVITNAAASMSGHEKVVVQALLKRWKDVE